jgi:hypothetical protein
MGKKVAILQSNYIPWKGYFDLINSVDEFVLYDTAQFTKNDWRNRNKIKTPKGLAWLTIPVRHDFGQAIQDTRIEGAHWARTHWASLRQNYANAPYLDAYRSDFQRLYEDAAGETHLSVVNHRLLVAICSMLGIRTRISWSRDYELIEGKTNRLVHLCQQLEANEYISGPAAKAYIDHTMFAEAGIKLTYIDYSGYPEYSQLFGAFEHGVSVVDLLFNEGSRAPLYMKSFSKEAQTVSALPQG